MMTPSQLLGIYTSATWVLCKGGGGRCCSEGGRPAAAKTRGMVTLPRAGDFWPHVLLLALVVD